MTYTLIKLPIKYRSLIFVGLFSFILGCTLTISFINLDDCIFKQRQVNVYSDHSITGSNSKLLVILILTSPENTHRRNVIRETWLKLSGAVVNIEHYFVVGALNLAEELYAKLEKEQSAYQDMLLLPNVEDSYFSLSKKMLEAFIWLDKSFTIYEYVLKCDDDSFVNTGKVLAELQLMKSSKGHLYWGFFNGRAHVKSEGKWKESEWILCDHYLPYALGGGYVLSKGLVNFIAYNAHLLRLYSSEDVSVGVWLAPLADVLRKHDPRFDTEFISRGCSNAYLVTHKKTENEMREMEASLRNSGNLCVKEYQNRLSYVYNWNVPPSKCCTRNNASIP